MTCCICGKGSGKFELKGWNINGKICKSCYPMFVRINDFCTKKVQLSDPYVFQDVKAAISYLQSIDVSEDNKKAVDNMITVSMNKLAQFGQAVLAENRRKGLTSPTKLLTTTGYSFEGYKITDYIGIVSAEIVLGTGVLSDCAASIKDFFGAKSGSYTNVLSKAKALVLRQLTNKAINVGANAVIGITFDITVIGNNMIVASVDGTAVVAEAENDQQLHLLISFNFVPRINFNQLGKDLCTYNIKMDFRIQIRAYKAIDCLEGIHILPE